MTKAIFVISAGLGAAMLSGCMQPTVKYSPNDIVVPNRIVTQQVEKPVLPEVKATYGIGNDPSVVRAYRMYQSSGKMQTIRNDGWVTYPYSADSKPIIACSMYHFCIVQLEAGEKLNSYGLGDTQDWQTNAFVTGEGPGASVSIQTKPVKDSISTDLTISTNKRTYLIGLVSKPGADTTVLRFYYPQETMITSIHEANQLQQGGNDAAVVNSSSAVNGTQININNVNFNYEIKGDSPTWRPMRVFDDGNKTYIQMPAIAAKFALPVLYLARNKQMQMVNYRYEQPYFIVDGLFSRAWLISGKGREQERVEILNGNIQA